MLPNFPIEFSCTDFNGQLKISDLEFLIRSVTGVNDCLINDIKMRADSTAFADGFSSVTSVVTSLNDVNPFQTMSNPYPNGIRAPTTAAQLSPGLNIGQTTNSAFLGIQTGQFQQWNFNIQRELGRNWLIEGAYTGNNKDYGKHQL